MNGPGWRVNLVYNYEIDCCSLPMRVSEGANLLIFNIIYSSIHIPIGYFSPNGIKSDCFWFQLDRLGPICEPYNQLGCKGQSKIPGFSHKKTQLFWSNTKKFKISNLLPISYLILWHRFISQTQLHATRPNAEPMYSSNHVIIILFSRILMISSLLYSNFYDSMSYFINAVMTYSVPLEAIYLSFLIVLQDSHLNPRT